MFPRDEDAQRELMYREQVKTNELLTQIIELLGKNELTETEGMKRQDLMKEFAKLENKPQGWNKWGTEKMRDYLRRESA